MAWLSGWEKRIQIDIDYTKIDAALSNFPVLIHLSTSSGINSDDVSAVFDELTSDGNRKKIAVTESNGTSQCYVEIERWDDANEAAWLWVKVPTVSQSADTTIYLYYDSSQADNTTYVGDVNDAVSANVWDSNFLFVLHLNEDPTGTIYDSTGNSYDFASTGSMVGGDLQDGPIGKAIHFDGSDDALQRTAGTPNVQGDSEITLECWFNLDTVPVSTAYEHFITNENSGNGLGESLRMYGDLLRGYLNIGEARHLERAGALSTLTDYYSALRWKSGEKIALFLDDGKTESASTVSGTLSRSGGNWEVGNWVYQGRPIDGFVDEVRISDIKRTDDWLKASYYSGADNLCDFGSEEIYTVDFSATITGQTSTSQVQLLGGFVDTGIADGAGLGDTIDAAGGSTSATLTDGAGLGDSIVALGPINVELPADQAGMGDSVAAGGTFNNFVTDGAGLSDIINGGLETNHTLSDQAGMGDSTEGLNWTEFLRENQYNYIIKYFCILTGAADGESDLEIPIQAFQARKRDGDPTYLSVTVPGFDLAEEIADRSNGQLVLQMAYFIGDTEQLREEILRVDLENIRTDQGPRNQSLTLSGHRTETFGQQIITLADPVYKYVSDGIRRYRFATPEPYINPGDTAKVGDDEFRVNFITYAISDRYRAMEITEA